MYSRAVRLSSWEVSYQHQTCQSIKPPRSSFTRQLLEISGLGHRPNHNHTNNPRNRLGYDYHLSPGSHQRPTEQPLAQQAWQPSMHDRMKISSHGLSTRLKRAPLHARLQLPPPPEGHTARNGDTGTISVHHATKVGDVSPFLRRLAVPRRQTAQAPAIRRTLRTTSLSPPGRIVLWDRYLHKFKPWQTVSRAIIRQVGQSRSSVSIATRTVQSVFPFSLVPALVRGHYICPAKVLRPDEYDAKKSPKPTDVFTSVRQAFPVEREWRRVIALIGTAIVYAFPSTEDNIKSYLDHLYDMLTLFAEQGDWSQIVDYDARLRLAFATRPALSFGDFKSPALLAIRTIATTSGMPRQRQQLPLFPHYSQPAPLHSGPGPSSSFPHSTLPGAPSARSSRDSNHASKRRPSQASTHKPIWHGSIKPSKPSSFPLPVAPSVVATHRAQP